MVTRLQVKSAKPEHYPWLLTRLGLSASPGFRAINAYVPDGPILGMVGYDSWAPNSVLVHIAIESPAALRALIYENGAPVFSYPFQECGVGVLLATVRADNAKSLNLCKRLGMRENTRIEDGAEIGVDMVLMELRREDCKYLKEVA